MKRVLVARPFFERMSQYFVLVHNSHKLRNDAPVFEPLSEKNKETGLVPWDVFYTCYLHVLNVGCRVQHDRVPKRALAFTFAHSRFCEPDGDRKVWPHKHHGVFCVCLPRDKYWGVGVGGESNVARGGPSDGYANWRAP